MLVPVSAGAGAANAASGAALAACGGAVSDTPICFEMEDVPPIVPSLTVSVTVKVPLWVKVVLSADLLWRLWVNVGLRRLSLLIGRLVAVISPSI